MRLLYLPYINVQRWIARTMASVLLLGAHEAQCAWHDKFFGTAVPVHYVRLTGYGGNNDVNRKNIAETHKACFRLQTSLGRAATPLPPEDVPPIIVTADIEIYYAANRTLMVDQGTLYDIDRDTCALRAIPYKRLELRSVRGRCGIDLIRKEAVGQCDATAHRRASASAREGLDGVRMPTVDLRSMLPAGTGLGKTVAGVPCEVHRHEPLRSTLCIAKPVPTPDRPLNPYPIPVGSLNAGVPGLLLEAETPALTLHAEQVLLNLTMSEDLFAVPPEVKVRPMPRGLK